MLFFWIEKNTPEAYLLYNLGWAALYLGHMDPFVLILHCWGALSGCTTEQKKVCFQIRNFSWASPPPKCLQLKE